MDLIFPLVFDEFGIWWDIASAEKKHYKYAEDGEVPVRPNACLISTVPAKGPFPLAGLTLRIRRYIEIFEFGSIESSPGPFCSIKILRVL
jgi:hypothetical protein